MKKLLIHIFIIALTILSTLSSCSIKSDDAEKTYGQQPYISKLPDIEMDIKDRESVIIIYYPTHISGLTTNNKYDSRECMPKDIELDWEDNIEKLGGTSVNIRYINRVMNPETLASMDSGGLIYITDPAQLIPLIEADMILSLNEYKLTVEGFDALDFEALLAFTDEHGQIWGLPSKNSSSLQFRAYSSKWLNILKADIPSSIYELESLGNRIKSVKSDKEIYLFGLSDDSSISFDLSDIFRAFGCYTQLGMDNISFDQLSGRYYDIVFTEEFKEAMEYLAHLIDINLVLYKSGTDFDTIWDKYEFLSGSHIEGELKTGIQLSGPNTEKLISLYNRASGFAVLKGTEDIDSKLDYFINNAYISKDLVNAYTNGVEGYHYDQINGEVNQCRDSTGQKLMQTPIYMDISLRDDYTTLIRNIVDTNRGNIFYLHTFNKAKLYNLPTEFYKTDEQSIDQIIYFNFKHLMHEILSLKKGVEEAVLDYELRISQTQYQEYMDWLNSP